MTIDSFDLEDNSTYSKFLSIYTRSPTYDLLSSESKGAFSLESHWSYISSKLFQQYMGPMKKDTYVESTVPIATIAQDETISDDVSTRDHLYFLEYQKSDEAQIRGIILLDYESDASQLAKFHHWFTKLVVKDSRLNFSESPVITDGKAQLALQVAEFFAEELKNTTDHDGWDAKGKSYFIERTKFFTQRNLTIEAVLPAFPCKSSNLQKVAGIVPDKGEELAFRRLIQFGMDIKKIYPPGLKLYVVSDGHVFSDCIGVDDDLVDSYTEQLKEFYYNLVRSMSVQDEELIGFVSLKDLLFGNLQGDYVPGLVEQVELPHHTGSKVCEDSELSRKMLMAGCDTDSGQLRRDINEEDHPRLHLYRGFSKFMFEDLKLNPHCKELSCRAFKKTISRVAFEMIKRNDAYSNLVELLFPFHLRLSIHAHANSGPKFGIRIIDPKTCRVIKELNSNEEPSFVDLLHIPTPWHNAIVKIEGIDELYMSKSKIVQDAIKAGHYSGEFVAGDPAIGAGGYYILKKN